MSDSVIDQFVRSVRVGAARGQSAQQVLDAVMTMIGDLRDRLDAPPAESEPFDHIPADSRSMSYMAFAAQLIKERAIRARHMEHALFGEPAWDMLLDLFHCREAGREVPVSSLCIASCVPSTTALRYIAWLEEENLIIRHRDKSDGRRMFLFLADEAHLQIASYLDDVAQLRGIRLYAAVSCPVDVSVVRAAYSRHRPQ